MEEKSKTLHKKQFTDLSAASAPETCPQTPSATMIAPAASSRSCIASLPSGTHDGNPLLYEYWQQQQNRRNMATAHSEGLARRRLSRDPSTQSPQQRRAERLRFLVAILDEALSIADETETLPVDDR
jgi:hypothetical protein